MKTITNISYAAFALFALACSALLPTTQAVVPAPDGGYANYNTAEGQNALFSLTTGIWNTALGGQALFKDNVGSNNTAVGLNALFFNVSGSYNTATGAQALQNNIAGYNTANGYQALFSNTTGGLNSALGFEALFHNTTGNQNTATGSQALQNNTTGGANTANGYGALQNNTTGTQNTANGVAALFFNTTGGNNTANGVAALFYNTTGDNNTAVGDGVLAFLGSGGDNTAIGSSAGSALTGSESGNVYIGSGAFGVAGESGVIRIGGTSSGETACLIGTDPKGGLGSDVVQIGGALSTIYAPSIINFISTNFADVGIDADGALVPFVSSARFKEDIKPMDKASESIFALKPVTFRYKTEVDATEAPQFGLIAEEVVKVNPSLVALDADGKPFSVNYRPVTAMLLNEFLKEHKAFVAEQRKVQEQGVTIARLEQQIETLTAGLQKVSAQLELSKRAPETVLNGQ